MFTEYTHAWFAASFYEQLTVRLGEPGRQAFIHATYCYGESRGRRMAQRAIRDGMPLTYGTYMEYGEWTPSPELQQTGNANQSVMQLDNGDVVLHISKCPWYDQFMRMGKENAGREYCAILDASIARGFNPQICYEVPQMLYSGNCCIQRIRNAGISEGEIHTKRMNYVRGFDYHCANLYYIFRNVLTAIFGAVGDEISAYVLNEFQEEFGTEMLDVLVRYRNTNFEVCD